MTAGDTACRGELVPLERLEHWDRLIQDFPQKRIFHEAVWLRFIASEQNGTPCVLRWSEPRSLAEVLWPGVVVRKGPLRIFGSPLRGWGTVALGPLYHGSEPEGLVAAAEATLRDAGIRHWEFVSETLGTSTEQGRHYRFESSDTHRIALHAEEKVMWAGLQQRCRTAIRKAEKNGLTAQRSSDPEFLDSLYHLVAAIFARQKFTPPYDAGRLRRLWGAMRPLGKVEGIEVRQGERLAAAGLFIHDERQAYAWSEASDPELNPLAPNNLLYWEAMKLYAAKGASHLHLPGAAGSPIGKFKASFNPEVLSYPFWIHDRDALLRWGRRAYQALYAMKSRWKYWRAS